MKAAFSPDFAVYLQSLCNDEKYRELQEFYTPTDAVGREVVLRQKSRRRLNLGLQVQTKPEQEEGKPEQEKIEQLPVLDGLRKYGANHVLLVGRPGSGKSTALERLFWEEGKKNLISV